MMKKIFLLYSIFLFINSNGATINARNDDTITRTFRFRTTTRKVKANGDRRTIRKSTKVKLNAGQIIQLPLPNSLVAFAAIYRKNQAVFRDLSGLKVDPNSRFILEPDGALRSVVTEE